MAIKGRKNFLIESIMDLTETKGIEISVALSKGLQKMNEKEVEELEELIYELVKRINCSGV